jgi:hypothetical protein
MPIIGEFGAAAREADPQAEPDQFKFYGETFTVAERVGAMPLLRFAAVAESGTQASEMEGMAAMYELIRDCLIPGDWPRFQKVAADNKATDDEFLEICGAVYKAATARPTQRPTDSVDGPSDTGESLKDPSFSVAFSPLGSVPPIQLDERVRALRPVSEAAREVALSG